MLSSKPRCSCRSSCSGFSCSARRWREGCGPASKKSGASSPPGGRWCSERGSFLLPASALIALGCLFLFGTVRVITAGQRKMALQSRLDLCAVERATERERFLSGLARSNRWVELSYYGVLAARGLKLLPVPGLVLVAGVSEASLVRANHLLTAWQEGELGAQQARELSGTRCEGTPYSTETALCNVHPMLVGSLKRPRSVYPDVKQRYRWKKPALGAVTCASLGGLRTRLELTGDRELKSPEYADHYAQ